MSDKLTEKTVKLDTPIMRGKTEITEIVLRKPQSGTAWHPSAGHYGYGRGRNDDCDPTNLHPDADRAGNGRAGPRRSHRAVGRGGDFFVEEVGACRFTDSLTIDDLVADIATIFHWSPSITDVMPLTEVLAWRYKAIQRSGASDE